MESKRKLKTPIPCPVCGKRLFDFCGHTCPDNFDIEIKCQNKQNTTSCGVVNIKTPYIEKKLAKVKNSGNIEVN
jgi:transcription elongation factor Elf1